MVEHHPQPIALPKLCPQIPTWVVIADLRYHVGAHDAKVYVSVEQLPYNIGCPLEPNLQSGHLQGSRGQDMRICNWRPDRLPQGWCQEPFREAVGPAVYPRHCSATPL